MIDNLFAIAQPIPPDPTIKAIPFHVDIDISDLTLVK